MSKQELFTRVVAGVKDYDWVDPATGERKRAAPGTTIQVTPDQAKAFSHVLIAPEVAAAQKAAAAAVRRAQEEAEAAALAARRAPPPSTQDADAKAEAEGAAKPAAKAGK
jgi:hypothetical protein